MIEETAAKYLGVRRARREEGRVSLARSCTSPATIRTKRSSKIAEKKKCDLIVMATHGEGGLFTSSVTRKVLEESKLPVLVFR